jgi:hypothetical protein
LLILLILLILPPAARAFFQEWKAIIEDLGARPVGDDYGRGEQRQKLDGKEQREGRQPLQS